MDKSKLGWGVVRWILVSVFVTGMAWASVRQVPDLQKRVTDNEKQILLMNNDLGYIKEGIKEIKEMVRKP